MQKLIIKPINYGIASRQGDIIYINQKLMAYPGLYDAILEHEEAHTDGFSLNDLYLDLVNPQLKGLKWQYWKFIVQNPSSWVEFSPVWFYEGRPVVNPFILLIDGLILGIFGGILWNLV